MLEHLDKTFLRILVKYLIPIASRMMPLFYRRKTTLKLKLLHLLWIRSSKVKTKKYNETEETKNLTLPELQRVVLLKQLRYFQPIDLQLN